MSKKVRFLSFSAAILIALLSVFAFSSCGEETEEVILNVYNWGEYISDGEDDSLNVNEAFENYFNENLAEEYGFTIKVNYTTYSSNEELYAKLKNTNTSYDVIIPSDYLIGLLIREDMLIKLNYDNIPNYEYIDPYYIEGNYYDPTNEYTVPYTMGKVGIIYNSAIIEDEIDSWEALWNEDYAEAGILQFNNSRDAFATAQFLLGIDINTTSKEELDKVAEKLLEQKAFIQKYVMDEVFNKMESGNAAIAPYYAGDYFTMYASNEDLAFAYPKEGSNTFVDAMCIPKCATYPELAELYINFMLEPEVAIANAEYICYASPHTAVRESEEYIEYMTEEIHPDAIAVLYDNYEKDFANEGFASLDSETQEYVNTLWDGLKMSGEIAPYVYVLSALIAASILFGIVFFTVRNRMRAKTY